MNTQTNYFKKALVVLMAVMMVFTMMPGMAWATDETETSSNESSEGNIVGAEIVALKAMKTVPRALHGNLAQTAR